MFSHAMASLVGFVLGSSSLDCRLGWLLNIPKSAEKRGFPFYLLMSWIYLDEVIVQIYGNVGHRHKYVRRHRRGFGEDCRIGGRILAVPTGLERRCVRIALT